MILYIISSEVQFLVGLLSSTQGRSQTFLWVGSLRREVDLFRGPFYMDYIALWCARCVKLGGSRGMPPPQEIFGKLTLKG